MPARRITTAQAKDRRNKKLAAVLGLVFVVVCVIQVPKLMKQLNPKAPAAAAPVASTAGSSGATSSPVSASPPSLAATAPGKLAAFARLPLKDPFHALVSAAAPTPTGASPDTAK